jgi:IS5 family transposase
MRRKQEAVFSFASGDEGLPKIVLQYRARYRAVSQVLDANPGILNLVHNDLQTLSEDDPKRDSDGREGDYTSENIMRALIVQDMEGLSYRDAVVHIGGSPFLQDFLRMAKNPVMDFTFLNRCFKAIRSETWKHVNEALGGYAVAHEMVSTKVIRTDTTVVESNIHYPTDLSLLWDVWRVASRLMTRGRKLFEQSCPHRFHTKKIKRLYLTATRFMSSKSADRQRRVKRDSGVLIERVEWIVAAAEAFCVFAEKHKHDALTTIATELKPYLSSMRTIVHNARRAIVQGETVPASERVFSLFEPHTELIKRGKRQKPVEFGHKVLLCESPEKFITDYEVYDKQKVDCELTETVIARHKKLFGDRPEVLAADMGFCPDEAKYEELAKQVATLAIPKRLKDYADKVLAHWYAFRAGIEGTISGLKRAFRLVRCFFRGFKSFAASVGLGVFCHNLIVLANQTTG